MASTVTVFPIAATGPLPRVSASVAYSGSGAADFTLLSNTWASDDPAIEVTFKLQQSLDAGLSWLNMATAVWEPQNFGKNGAMPSATVIAQDSAGARLLRAQLSASSSIQVGLSAAVA